MGRDHGLASATGTGPVYPFRGPWQGWGAVPRCASDRLSAPVRAILASVDSVPMRKSPVESAVTDGVRARVTAALDRLALSSCSIVVAVSGGADSVALLRALLDRREAYSLQLTVGHLNHCLRGTESDADELFVRTTAQQLGLPTLIARQPVPDSREFRRLGIEGAAREIRYAFLLSAARQTDARFVVTGHTADDQAETILQQIIRGTGLNGLAGMPFRRSLDQDVELLRPFLDVRREEIRSYLGMLGQSFREDSSNSDERFTRNLMRRKVIPTLQAINPDVVGALCRLGRISCDACRTIDELVDDLARRAVMSDAPERVVLAAGALDAASSFLRGELFRRVIRKQGWPLRDVGQREIDRIDEVLRTGRSHTIPGGIRARRLRSCVVLDRGPIP